MRRALSVGKHRSTRVDEEIICCTLVAIKMQGAYRRVEREKSLLYDPGSELGLGIEQEKEGRK